MATLIEKIVAEVSTLPNELQKEVLNYVEYLKNKIPEPTKEQRFLSLLIEQGLIDEPNFSFKKKSLIKRNTK
jgi:hypothetical protein